MQYELFYLVASSKEAQLDKIKQEVSDLVKSEGGIFEEKVVVEKRKMAYEINHENRGLYVAQRFNLEDPTKMNDITRKLNLYTEVLRSVVTRTDELPELTSRQEREAKAQTKVEPRAEVKKVVRPEVAPKAVEAAPAAAPTEKVEESEAPAPKEKPMNEEDIDKKLEEILNI